MYTRFNTLLWTLYFKRCVSNFKTNSYLRTKGRFRGGPRGPRRPLLSGKFFSFVNVCRMVLRTLLLKYIFFNKPCIVNKKRSCVRSHFGRKWPKLPECMQYYPSPTNWIWQFFRETVLPPLPGGCALPAIASAPANIIKCYITSLTTTTPVVY